MYSQCDLFGIMARSHVRLLITSSQYKHIYKKKNRTIYQIDFHEHIVDTEATTNWAYLRKLEYGFIWNIMGAIWWDISFRGYLLLMQKADNGLFHPSILTWSCIKFRSAKHFNSFRTLIVNPNSVQNRHKNQSTLNFKPTSRCDSCD